MDGVHQEALQFAIAIILGGLIGFERKLSGKDPSLKTFSLICFGSCLFTVASLHAASQGTQMADPGRIAAQIASGVGFLGAGAIFRSEGNVSGLTTAAYMWFTAAVGVMVGLKQFQSGILAVILSLVMIFVYRMLTRFLLARRKGLSQQE